MIACLDVDYRGHEAVAAGLLFRDWADPCPAYEGVVPTTGIHPHEPGRFYLRELPCLLAILKKFDHPLEVIIIDGYVWLGDEDEPGLGAHLYRVLDPKVAVIGVAKTRFAGARLVEEVYRGTSRSPLHVSAVGIGRSEAAQNIREMHGPHRIPTLLKRVDRLCRDHQTSGRTDGH